MLGASLRRTYTNGFPSLVGQPLLNQCGVFEIDRDKDFHEEVRNAARSLVSGVRLLRRGEFKQPDSSLREPRPK